jgi:hypothetical protein
MAKKGTDTAGEGEEAGRRLDDVGVRLVVNCFPEVRDWWNRYCAARAYQRERAGEAVGGGEKKGAGAALARLICWATTLCDEDLERIDREGAGILDGLSRLPADHGRVPGRADPMTIPRRAASVFGGPGHAATSVPDDPAGPVVLKPVGLHRNRMEDQPLGQDVAAEGDDIPAGPA